MTKNTDRDQVGSSDQEFTAQVQAARRNRELIAMLAQWRAELNLSQAKCAKLMHTSQPAVARLESHQHDAQLSTLARYVTALGLTLHFVLTDSKTGYPVWTSLFGSTGPELPDSIKIVEDTWTKLSGRDLTPHQYVITAAKEPGWSLVYKPSRKQAASLKDATPTHSGRTQTAEDPHVVGFFDLEDPDPVAIATAIESDGDRVHQVHTLAAKFKEPLSSVEVQRGDADQGDSSQHSEALLGYYSGLVIHDAEVANQFLGLTGHAQGLDSHAETDFEATSTEEGRT
jgi:transcriptional regulator with XRE-family HTH domain